MAGADQPQRGFTVLVENPPDLRVGLRQHPPLAVAFRHGIIVRVPREFPPDRLVEKPEPTELPDLEIPVEVSDERPDVAFRIFRRIARSTAPVRFAARVGLDLPSARPPALHRAGDPLAGTDFDKVRVSEMLTYGGH